MLRTREDLPVARRQQASKSPRPFPIGPVVLSVSLALGVDWLPCSCCRSSC